MRLSLRDKKIIVNKLYYTGNNILFQNTSKRKLKTYSISTRREKMQPPRHLAQLSIWRYGLDNLEKQNGFKSY